MPGRVELIWLDGERVVDAGDVGARAAALASLRTAGLPALKALALGRRLHEQCRVELGEGGSLVQLPREVSDAVLRGLRQLGGPWAVRRSLVGMTPAAGHAAAAGAHAHQESFLHVVDPGDVIEAVRRIWDEADHAGFATAVVVQRFVIPDASARAHEEGAGAIAIESSYGVGDLLAAGLVVPDRHVVGSDDGVIRSRVLGRKSQMTIPSSDGGLIRVPVPVASAREFALSDEAVIEIARIWHEAEAAIGRISSISLAAAGDKLAITTVAPAMESTDPGLMLG